MNYSISNNAEYGEYVTGPEVINEQSRAAMRNALRRIQDGEYAKMFISEGATNYPAMTARRRNNAAHPIEQVGEKTACDDAVDDRPGGDQRAVPRSDAQRPAAHSGW